MSSHQRTVLLLVGFPGFILKAQARLAMERLSSKTAIAPSIEMFVGGTLDCDQIKREDWDVLILSGVLRTASEGESFFSAVQRHNPVIATIHVKLSGHTYAQELIRSGVACDDVRQQVSSRHEHFYGGLNIPSLEDLLRRRSSGYVEVDGVGGETLHPAIAKIVGGIISHHEQLSLGV